MSLEKCRFVKNQPRLYFDIEIQKNIGKRGTAYFSKDRYEI